jgi:hypothetical protein
MTFDAAPCDCQSDLGAAHYGRLCDYCGTAFAGSHCVHDPRQDPCPECQVVPVPQLV